MKTTEWYFSVLFTLISYLFFSNVVEYRLFFLIIFPVIFSVVISADEWRMGRVVLLTLLPILIGLTLMFIVSVLGESLFGSHSIVRAEMVRAAYGFLVLLFLSVLVGGPLAAGGAVLRRYQRG